MPVKPLLILQHSDGLPPGYFGAHLARAGFATLAVRIRNADDVPAPAILNAVSGLASMGGAASAQAKHTRLEAEIGLLGAALDRGLPVFGHGLGARLLARAGGGSAHATPVPEIGWHPVSQRPEAAATRWLSRLSGGPHHVFMHHHEAFEPPPGALALLSSTITPCQAFVSGTAVGVQFHPEVTRAAFAEWLARERATLPAPALTVQSAAEMEAEAPARIDAGRRLAATFYDFWLAQVQAVTDTA